MQVMDLSHTYYNNMPHWPDEPEVFVEGCADLSEHGFREKLLRLTTHSGTHMDAPSHLLREGATLDSLPPSQFVGRAVVVDCRGQSAINLRLLQEYSEQLMRAEFVLFFTGWSKLYKDEAYLHDYPVLTQDAATYLLSLQLKGLGIDCPSFDVLESKSCPIHRTLLGNGVVLIENLRNLRNLCGKEFTLLAAPIKIRESDGAPTRVFAML